MAQKINFLNGIARSVTSLKSAAIPGPCFLTGSYVTKKLTAAPSVEVNLRAKEFLVQQMGRAVPDGFVRQDPGRRKISPWSKKILSKVDRFLP